MGIENLNIDDIEREESHERYSLKLYNGIQRELMAHACSPDEGEECIERWIEENSQKYKEVFQSYIKERPNLEEEWEISRDRILDDFHERMSQR